MYVHAQLNGKPPCCLLRRHQHLIQGISQRESCANGRTRRPSSVWLLTCVVYTERTRAAITLNLVTAGIFVYQNMPTCLTTNSHRMQQTVLSRSNNMSCFALGRHSVSSVAAEDATSTREKTAALKLGPRGGSK